MSNKISMKNIIVNHLRNLADGKALTKLAAKEVAEAIMLDACECLTDRDGEVVFGNVGKLMSKRYPEAIRFNPSSKRREPRAAYKTVRFRAFKAAKTQL